MLMPIKQTNSAAFSEGQGNLACLQWLLPTSTDARRKESPVPLSYSRILCLSTDVLWKVSGKITALFWNSSTQNCTIYRRLVDVTQSITQIKLSMCTSLCLRKTTNLIKDLVHSWHSPFSPLPLGSRYKSLKTHNSRVNQFFFLSVIRLLNSPFIS